MENEINISLQNKAIQCIKKLNTVNNYKCSKNQRIQLSNCIIEIINLLNNTNIKYQLKEIEEYEINYEIQLIISLLISFILIFVRHKLLNESININQDIKNVFIKILTKIITEIAEIEN